MRTAVVYMRKGSFLVEAMSKTTDGVWIASVPHLAVPETHDDEALGSAIRAALDGSRIGVPHPDFRDKRAHMNLMSPILKLAGVKSWRTFQKTATCVDVEEEGARMVIVPQRNLGPDGGFEPVEVSRVVLERPASTEIGAAVRQLLTTPVP